LVACVAAVRFEHDAARWVRRFKYAGRGLAGLDPAAPAVVTGLVREAARRLPGPAADAVLPVPIHPRRERLRGFHPAGVLARSVARSVGATLALHALQRARDTPSQTDLTPEERVRNVSGAFVGAGVPGARLWLVDDVVTTGATLGEAARTLLAAGAHEVLAVCAARTPRVEGPPANG
jgi:predicted amidophosphoribosyltransferase